MPSVIDGIVIGGAGGAIAGITVWLVHYTHDKAVELIHKKRVYGWLLENSDKDSYRTTRVIASHNNLTEDRVRYICSIDARTRRSTGEEEVWRLRERGAKTS